MNTNWPASWALTQVLQQRAERRIEQVSGTKYSRQGIIWAAYSSLIFKVGAKDASRESTAKMADGESGRRRTQARAG